MASKKPSKEEAAETRWRCAKCNRLDDDITMPTRLVAGKPACWQCFYTDMIQTAATAAREEAQHRASMSDIRPLRLYYKPSVRSAAGNFPGALLLAVNSDNVPPEYRETGRELLPTVPFDQYAQWIRNHSGDLAVL